MADIQMFGFHPAGTTPLACCFMASTSSCCFICCSRPPDFCGGSFVVAALFAIHPLNVECVAWVSERKSLLCTLFLFLALFAYGWYVRKPGIGRYVLVALMFAFGLLAKPMIVTLLCASLADYWPLNRLPIPDSSENVALFFKKFASLALEKIPLLLLSGASAYITVIAQSRAKAIAAKQILPISVRIPNALWSYLQYLVKTVWPMHLAIFYPHPEDRLGLWKPLLATTFLLAFTGWCFVQRRQRYLACRMAVVSGLPGAGDRVRASRAPGYGRPLRLHALVGNFHSGVWWIADHSKRLLIVRRFLQGAAAIFLLFFGALTWRQTTYWKDNFTLFNHAVETTSANFIAENNLGEAYMQIGQPTWLTNTSCAPADQTALRTRPL